MILDTLEEFEHPIYLRAIEELCPDHEDWIEISFKGDEEGATRYRRRIMRHFFAMDIWTSIHYHNGGEDQTSSRCYQCGRLSCRCY